MSTAVDHCVPLPQQFTYVDPKGAALTQELLDTIVDAVVNSPRSLQKKIGPSEVGSCTRLLGYKLLQIPERPRVPAWKAAVGTGGHLLMEQIFDAYNVANAVLLDGQERFYIETRVDCGEINGVPLTGSSDVYDRVTGTVIDWKFPGPSMLDSYRRKRHPGLQYRNQAHLYGRGWVRAGLPVTRVMIVFLPRHGELDDAYIWTEEYDEQVALDALQRLSGVDTAVRTLGAAALELLPTDNQYCNLCAYLKRDSTDLSQGCPGDAGSNVAKPRPSTEELLSSGRR